MRNVLLMTVVLFCASCGATVSETNPTAANIPPTAEPQVLTPTPAPQCEYSFDAPVAAIREAGLTQAVCIVEVDLDERTMQTQCANGDTLIPVPGSTLPPPGNCEYSFDSPALMIHAFGLTRAICRVEVNLTDETLMARCTDAEEESETL